MPRKPTTKKPPVSQPKPASEEAADLNSKPEAGGEAAKPDAAEPTKPAEDPTPPDGEGLDNAQAPATDAPASAEANQQPGDGDPPAVSGPDTSDANTAQTDDELDNEFQDDAEQLAPPGLYVRTKRKKARRRSGLAFGPEAVLVTPAAFPETVDGAKAFLAILEDPALVCAEIDEEGNEQPLPSEAVEEFRAMIAEREAETQSESAD